MRLWISTWIVVVLAAAVPNASAQFVAPGGTIPVVANAAGLAGTFWRSDVDILNVGGADTHVILQLFPEIVGGEAQYEMMMSDQIAIAAGEQLNLSNVLQATFGLANTKGALRIFSADGAPLVLSSRTYTSDQQGGTFGQDVTGVMVATEAWASGLRNDSLYRTNVGIFWPGFDAVQFTITVFDNTGQELATGTISFDEAGLQQRTLDSFGVEMMLGGYLQITCSDTTAGWFAYASRVDQATGDAVFRPARGRLTDM